MSIENEENYTPEVPVSRQMTVIMCLYSPPGDARMSSMGWALWALTKTQFIISIVYDTIDANAFNQVKTKDIYWTFIGG
jgi:hypothetical protein